MKTLFSVCDLSLKSSRLHKYHDLNICLCAGLEYSRLQENCTGLDEDFGSGLDTFLHVCFFFVYRSSQNDQIQMLLLSQNIGPLTRHCKTSWNRPYSIYIEKQGKGFGWKSGLWGLQTKALNLVSKNVICWWISAM